MRVPSGRPEVMSANRFLLALLSVVIGVGASSRAEGQELTSKLYDSMRWRMIGPFRGGRTVGAVGVPGQPSVFYNGVNNGGVRKTNQYGRTCKPTLHHQP